MEVRMKHLKLIIALSIIVVIPFCLMIWFRIRKSTGFASIELIAYPLFFGGGSVGVLFLLKAHFLKGILSDFNFRQSKWFYDIGWGVAISVIYFILFYLERMTLAKVLRFNPNRELLGLMLDMRRNPILLILWFGPVLWIGIALYEESIRVFILLSLWDFSRNIFWIITVIIFSAIIFGLLHWSQGLYGIVTISIKSLVGGFFYFKKRRLAPLIYAHVLYDGLQVGNLLLTYGKP
ncbi:MULTISPECIES: CPBP family intramembrane glutamic endopeptidase [unclassified Oceanispirochaeta]|uniref:CPBP family intramembrane glutamic endopeptidase n=1 Tax=unclassified Oceanispirochaeta TaxID=2635722 RepID=UPI000E095D14|nr:MULTISPECIES: CPBP family intramembrane glutamic endopeptidase [unclassified Oceanispirochaeta]MBF9017472.1 CPBP family intramembrane metalloprotease [Oceanispirochaeta sp. M2]NPD74044.1 CPBP family intramembrane metalloprotease [Oceanispirochaeta sp. M1]RDG30086.1 CPBP family intramembrane metalloprotease [Oceanispirochaeta sp. M1]